MPEKEERIATTLSNTLKYIRQKMKDAGSTPAWCFGTSEEPTQALSIANKLLKVAFNNDSPTLDRPVNNRWEAFKTRALVDLGEALSGLDEYKTGEYENEHKTMGFQSTDIYNKALMDCQNQDYKVLQLMIPQTIQTTISLIKQSKGCCYIFHNSLEIQEILSVLRVTVDDYISIPTSYLTKKPPDKEIEYAKSIQTIVSSFFEINGRLVTHDRENPDSHKPLMSNELGKGSSQNYQEYSNTLIAALQEEIKKKNTIYSPEDSEKEFLPDTKESCSDRCFLCFEWVMP